MIDVVAAVVIRNKRALVCLRPRTKQHGLLWEFPGGKLEPHEALADGLNRELREELGIDDAQVIRHLWDDASSTSGYRIHFVLTHIDGEVSCLEHEAIRWVGHEEIRHLAFAPADQAFLQQFAVSLLGDS